LLPHAAAASPRIPAEALPPVEPMRLSVAPGAALFFSGLLPQRVAAPLDRSVAALQLGYRAGGSGGSGGDTFVVLRPPRFERQSPDAPRIKIDWSAALDPADADAVDSYGHWVEPLPPRNS
jgi:hypothetical protein